MNKVRKPYEALYETEQIIYSCNVHIQNLKIPQQNRNFKCLLQKYLYLCICLPIKVDAKTEEINVIACSFSSEIILITCTMESAAIPKCPIMGEQERQNLSQAVCCVQKRLESDIYFQFVTSQQKLLTPVLSTF